MHIEQTIFRLFTLTYSTIDVLTMLNIILVIVSQNNWQSIEMRSKVCGYKKTCCNTSKYTEYM